MLKPIEKHRVSDDVVGQLRTLILSGAYPPGSKLRPERELARDLGVNRSSLREALKQLEQLGLIRARQGDGTRVENFMETAGIELVGHLLPMARDPSMIRDLLEVRRMLGREIGRLAADRITPAELDELRSQAALADDPALPLSELFRIDVDLYVLLTAIARNRALVLLVNSVREAMKPHYPLLAMSIASPDHIREHHRRLIDALAAGDGTRTIAEVDAHMARGSELVESLIAAGMLEGTGP